MRSLADFSIVVRCNINGTEVDFDIFQYVESYRLHGGPEQPVRYVTLEVSKLNIDKIRTTVDDVEYTLVDNIVQGQTKMFVRAVGTGSFIITKVQLEDYTYEITAYGVEIILNSMILSTSIIRKLMNDDTADFLTGTTSEIAHKLVDFWFGAGDSTIDKPGLNLDYLEYMTDSFKTVSGNTVTYNGNIVSFGNGMSFLNIIQVCALIENAFVFFGDEWDETAGDYLDTFFFVSYDDSLPLASNPASAYSSTGFRKGVSMDGVLNIYPGFDDPHENYSEMDLQMYNQSVSLASQTSEGADTIVNYQVVQIADENGIIQSIPNDDEQLGSTEGEYTGGYNSIAAYGEYGGTVLSLLSMRGVWMDSGGNIVPEGTPGAIYNLQVNAKRIANNLVKRYRDPSESIVIMMSETQNASESDSTITAWDMAFSAFSHANFINDDVNDIHLSYYHNSDRQYFEENPSIVEEYGNRSIDNALLRVSTFTYCYPELATQYKFGVSKQADLTQTIAALQKSAQ